ncbi:chromosome partitioning protein ParB, partial [Pseudomonas kurunegalensis]|nr:chromosome partitioning protein ParB [Pseudomonas kurunegalensis]
GVGQDTDTTSGSEPEAPTGLHSPELVCSPQPADRQPEQADLKQPPAVTREQVRTPTAPPPAQSANLGSAGRLCLPDSLDTLWPIPPALEDLVQLRQACAQLASELAGYANAPHMVCATEEGLGFSLAPDTAAPSTPHRTGIQLLLGALLRVQDDVAWEQRQQLPAALFGQLLLGAYDLPLIERPQLAIGIERLPDPQLAQLFSLIRLSRRLIELTLSSTR